MTDGPMSRYRDLVATGRLRDDPGWRLKSCNYCTGG